MSFLRPSAAKQTTASVGTGAVVLIANAGETRSLQAALGTGPIKCRYRISGNGYFETGRGTFTAPSALTRDEVILSSNSNSLVNIPPGSSDVYLLDYAQFMIDSFSGTTKTLTNADASNSWIFTGSSASVLTLPAISATLPDFWGVIRNVGTANVTLTAPGSDVIDESNAQTVVIGPGDSAFVFLDPTNGVWRVLRTLPRLSTRQVLTSGSGATYTTPRGVRQLRVRLKAAGGGGGGNEVSAVNGASGGNTSFDNAGANVVANGGVGGTAGSLGALGGASGTGTGTGIKRWAGASGGQGGTAAATIITSAYGGTGGGKGGGPSGTAGVANTGGGGGGALVSSPPSQKAAGPGGGEGEEVEFIINNPAASYTYTVGVGGAAGASGGAGASGVIIVEEIY